MDTRHLQDLIDRFLLEPEDERRIAGFYRFLTDIALTALRKNYKHKYSLLSQAGYTEHDFAHIAVASLFVKQRESFRCPLQDFLLRLRAAASGLPDSELYSAFNGMISRRIKQTFSRVLAEFDPAGMRLRQCVFKAVAASAGLELRRFLRVAWIVRKGRLQHDFSEHPYSRSFLCELASTVSANSDVPEILQAVFDVSESHYENGATAWKVSDLVELLKYFYSRCCDEGIISNEFRTTGWEMIEYSSFPKYSEDTVQKCIECTCRQLQSGLLARYVSCGKVNETCAGLYLNALRRMLLDFVSGDMRSQYEYFQLISPSILPSEYRRLHRHVFEYVFREARRVFTNRLEIFFS